MEYMEAVGHSGGWKLKKALCPTPDTRACGTEFITSKGREATAVEDGMVFHPKA
jgi:hypothetical protein